ncbi:unnamed protein product, partial [Mesorhabditis spiculigera]
MDEMTLLIDVKAPNITAYFHSYQFYKTSSPDINKALEPTLNIFVEQWQRGERQIDTSLLILRAPSRRVSETTTRLNGWTGKSSTQVRHYTGYLFAIVLSICGLPGKLLQQSTGSASHRLDQQ